MGSVQAGLSNHVGVEPPQSARCAAAPKAEPRGGWSDERVEALKALNAQGLSASQIAKQLGRTTRCAVIGKLNRLGIGLNSAVSQRNAAELRRLAPKPDPRPRPPKAPVVPRAPYQGNGHNLRHGQTGFKPSPEPPPEIARPDDVARVTLLELRQRHCRWPIGMPGDDGFGFCGLDAEGPYCAGHAAAARQPPRPGSPRTGNELMRSLRRYA